ncbi:hypothetical protein BASA81_000170 [Batrachochytrium salamandrivorans]|nr:hypothetical protein BASA81_000170 [Batrachochytrium salamandrivorans]
MDSTLYIASDDAKLLDGFVRAAREPLSQDLSFFPKCLKKALPTVLPRGTPQPGLAIVKIHTHRELAQVAASQAAIIVHAKSCDQAVANILLVAPCRHPSTLLCVILPDQAELELLADEPRPAWVSALAAGSVPGSERELAKALLVQQSLFLGGFLCY